MSMYDDYHAMSVNDPITVRHNLFGENHQLRECLDKMKTALKAAHQQYEAVLARRCDTCVHRQAFTKDTYLCKLHAFVPVETFGYTCGKWTEQ